MILLANIGNTNLTYGIYHTKMIATERFPMIALSDRHCIEKLCLSLMEKFHLSMEQMEGVALSSVVPEKTPLFMEVLQHFFSIEPILISDSTDWGLDRSEYSGILGSDRLLCCKAALKKYQPPFIVVDYGTATTMNVINQSGAFAGGVILPGVMTGMQALAARTSQLNTVALTNPKNVIGKNTTECMLSGAIYGTAALIEGLVRRIQDELEADTPVILTGGNSEAIIPYCTLPFQYEPVLLLEGLAMIYTEIIQNKSKGELYEFK